MRLSHTDAESCPSCEDKLREVHPALVSWFHQVKGRYQSVHVNWGWRGEVDQNRLFKEQKTNATWPHSKHNAVQDGKPCSLALDLFQLDEDGVARFSRQFYAKLAKESWESKEPIIWGGDWNSDGIQGKNDWDGPHFELKDEST